MKDEKTEMIEYFRSIGQPEAAKFLETDKDTLVKEMTEGAIRRAKKKNEILKNMTPSQRARHNAWYNAVKSVLQEKDPE